MEKKIVYASIGFVLLIIAAVVVHFLSPSVEPIDRFEGPIPYVFTSAINKTVRHYVETRPSRFVLLIGGPSQSGKSRLIDILASEAADHSRLVIKLDVAAANSIEEFAKFLKVAIVEGLTNIRASINANKLKNVNNEIDMSSEASQETVLDPKVAKLFNLLGKTIDGAYKNGLSERNIHRFFYLLEALSDDFNPIIFMHNYDKLATLGTKDDPEFGKKLISSLIAVLSRRDLYQDTIPIVLEIKNTLYLINKSQNPIFRYFEMGELGDVSKELVEEAPIFNQFELKNVIKTFGAHGGSIAKIFESLRYGQKIDKAINKLIQSIKVTTKNKIVNNPNAQLFVKHFCESKKPLYFTNITDIDSISPLFNNLLYLSKDFQVKASNRAVFNALCVNE